MITERVERVTLEKLAERAPLHVLDIAEKIDEHPVTVDQACARLHDRGDIYSVGLGRYEVTDQGRRRCDDEFDSQLGQEGSSS